MGLLDPIPPPYDALAWAREPFVEKARKVCQAWALQGYGTPLVAYAFYAAKILIYIGIWWLTLRGRGPWEPIAFEKAILWNMLFEGLGLGCGSGPLTGRYSPPIGGFLYFLRPGTTKLPLAPRLPLLGGTRRTWLDAALYLVLVAALVRALTAPAPDAG